MYVIRSLLGLSALFIFVNCSSAPSGTVWTVDDGHHSCIRLESKISLNVTYNVITTTNQHVTNTTILTVDDSATVDASKSSCNVYVPIYENNILSQVLTLDLAHSYPGWSLKLYFSQDRKFHLTSTEYALYKVEITGNFTANNDIFPNHKDDTYKYTHDIDWSDEDSTELFDVVYTNVKFSYYCNSKQTFLLNKGLKAWVSFSKFHVQAFSTSGTTKFSKRDTCPQDQADHDLVPVIVGAFLAVLVTTTLVIYLVYRARQPPSVLYLTNSHSHFEDFEIPIKHHDNEGFTDDAPAATNET